MEKIQFRCELLSDIVLNDSSATEGKRRSLDFIPGNNFLGIVASQLYKETDEAAWIIFHSGHVRFGDAHPSANGTRGLRIPAAFFYPKLKGIEGGRPGNAAEAMPGGLLHFRSGAYCHADYRRQRLCRQVGIRQRNTEADGQPDIRL